MGGRCGDGSVVSTVESFDGSVWSADTNMSTPRRNFGLAALDSKLYAIGGEDASFTTIADVEVSERS